MASKRNRYNNKIDHSKYGWTATYKIGKAVTSRFNLEEVLSLIGKIACAVTRSCSASIITIDNPPLRVLVSAKAAGASSTLCLPAIFNGRKLATLTLSSAKKRHYTKEHAKIASALAYQIALVIQNYHLYTNMHLNYFNTIKSLVLAMEAKDPYTKGHSERVTKYALIIAGDMDLHPQQVQMIKYCGMLHDLGKIAISDDILNKPGSLTQQERSQIERHPEHGAEVLSPLTFLREGISLVKHHHERFDGAGYPDGLKADRIPVTARILACADAYDAMTSDRPYRSRLTKEQAVEELRNNSGTQFDPRVTDVFLKSLESIQ